LNYEPLITPLLPHLPHQPRQFEFHPTEDIMVVGTVKNEVVILDWRRNEAVHTIDGPSQQDRNQPSPQVLALCWENGIKPGARKSRIIAGSNEGCVCVYNYDYDKQEISLQHDYGKLYNKLTSVHVNSDNRYLAISGYENHVNIVDLETGQKHNTFRNVHTRHINITRFANHFPNMLLSCSFDKTCKMWDMRVGDKQPVFTMESESGFVMVTFSPSDLYFLASAVDNHVTQYRSIDGSEHTKLDLPQTGSLANYTRAYYMTHSRDIVVGSADESVVRICSSVSGKVTWESEIKTDTAYRHFHIQSLRCNPKEPDRLGLLLYHRYLDEGFRLIDVDLRRSPHQTDDAYIKDGADRTTLADLAYDLSNEASRMSEEMRLCFKCQDKGEVRAHGPLIIARWQWLRGHDEVRKKLESDKEAHLNIKLPRNACQVLVSYLYSGVVDECIASEMSFETLFDIIDFTNKKELKLGRLNYLLIMFLMEKVVTPYCALELMQLAQASGNKRTILLLEDYCSSFYHYFATIADIEKAMGPSFQRVHDMYKQSVRPNRYVKAGRKILTHMKERMYHNAQQVGNFVYCLGGYNCDGPRDIKHISVLNVKTLIWGIVPTYPVVEEVHVSEGRIVRTRNATLPIHFLHYTSAVVGKKIYLFGGERGRNNKEISLFVLNTETLKFQRIITDVGPSTRFRSAMCASDSHIWVYGGQIPTNNSYTDELWSFDVNTLIWHMVHFDGMHPGQRVSALLAYSHRNKSLMVGCGHFHPQQPDNNHHGILYTANVQTKNFVTTNCFDDLVTEPATWRLFPLSWVISTTDNEGNPAELLIVAGGGSGRRNVYGDLNEIRVINILNKYETTRMDIRGDRKVTLDVYNKATFLLNPGSEEPLIAVFGGSMPHTQQSGVLWTCDVVSAWRSGRKCRWKEKDMYVSGLTPLKLIESTPCTFPQDMRLFYESRDNPGGLRKRIYPAHDTDVIRYCHREEFNPPLDLKSDELELLGLDEEIEDEIEASNTSLDNTTTMVCVKCTNNNGDVQDFIVSRSILRARSLMFRTQFNSSMADAKAATVSVQGNHEALLTLLFYMYTGSIDFSRLKEIGPFELLQLADRLQVEGLLDFMQTACLQYINCENVVDFILFAQTCQLASLYNAALIFIIVNFDDVSQKRNFGRLSEDLQDNLNFLYDKLRSVTSPQSNDSRQTFLKNTADAL